MRCVKAIFVKQAKDMLKNPMVLVMFIIFPLVAFIMTQLVALQEDDIPNNMFVTMMAAVFSGMGLISAAAGYIAEDIERKSLRFMVMAGVKPFQYLCGTGGFLLFAGTVTSVLFSLIGDFTFNETINFLIVMVAGTAASIVLGTTIGMISKNQQAATSLGMPIAMLLGFAPMIANFNETVKKAAAIMYTQQINVVVNDLEAGLLKPLLVIAINIAVFAVLFVIVYKKKGLQV
ncbi:MAG: ABC transporter permease [Defluviitaleaceae bacterium]|nr:ABC transporter permease [Defluviitaleaceae bacterium]